MVGLDGRYKPWTSSTPAHRKVKGVRLEAQTYPVANKQACRLACIEYEASCGETSFAV